MIAAGFRPFFEWIQLKMIVENLHMQKPEFSDTELIQAIQYYFDHDASIAFS